MHRETCAIYPIYPGHEDITTTDIYLHVAVGVHGVVSPLETLGACRGGDLEVITTRVWWQRRYLTKAAYRMHRAAKGGFGCSS